MMSIHMSRPMLASFALLALLTGVACAQGNQPGEYELLKPGNDSNLSWIPFSQALGKASEEKKAVMVYFYSSTKTTKNARGMIAAEMRAFPDERVQEVSTHILCTKVDLLKPGDATKGAKRGAKAKKGAGEVAKAAGGGLLLPTSRWPEEVSIYFFDYQGRLLQKLTKIPSSAKKMASTMTSIAKGNAKRIIADEKAAKKAAAKAAREKERAEKKLAREEARRAAEEKAKAEEESKEKEDGEDEKEEDGEDD